MRKPLSGMAYWKFWQVQQLGAGKAPAVIIVSFLLCRVGEGSTGAGVTRRKDLELSHWLQGLKGKEQSHSFSSLGGLVLRVFCSYCWKILLKYNVWLNLVFPLQKQNKLFAFCVYLS